jgi:beta-galactosidase
LLGQGLLHFSRNDSRIEVTIHAAPGDESKLIVFVANPTAEAIDAEIDMHLEIRSVRELWEDRPVEVHGGKLREAFPPYTINIYECVR